MLIQRHPNHMQVSPQAFEVYIHVAKPRILCIIIDETSISHWEASVEANEASWFIIIVCIIHGKKKLSLLSSTSMRQFLEIFPYVSSRLFSHRHSLQFAPALSFNIVYTRMQALALIIIIVVIKHSVPKGHPLFLQ